MKAAITFGPRDIRVEEVPIPRIDEGEVLVKVKAVGICGSDLHYHRKESINRKPPFIAGHEVSGEIVEIGGKVTNLYVGERVAIEPLQICGKCDYCRQLRYNLCVDIQRLAGGFAEYAKFPAYCVHRIPEKISFEEAAFIEVMAVGLHTLDIQQIKLGDNVLIVGDGPVGLTICRLCVLSGVHRVGVAGLNERALHVAREIGVDKVFNLGLNKRPLVEMEIGFKPDIIFECVGGFSQVAEEIAQILPKGGKIVVVGIFKRLQSLDFALLTSKEAEIKFSSCFATRGGVPNFELATDLVVNQKVTVDKLITHRFSLYETPKAFDTLLNNKQHGIIKAIVLPDHKNEQL
jgi:L-iditol 2-dehydrogenase